MELYMTCIRAGFTAFEARLFCGEEIKRMIKTGEIIKDESFDSRSFVPEFPKSPKPICLKWHNYDTGVDHNIEPDAEKPWRDIPIKVYKSDHGLTFVK